MPRPWPIDDPSSSECRIAWHDHFEVVHRSGVAVVEDLAIFRERRWRAGSCPVYLLGVPYHGLFGYQAEGKRELYDANRLLFVSANQDYVEDHPVDGVGHASLLIEPSQDVLEEVCQTRPDNHEAFCAVARLSPPRVRLLAHRLLARKNDLPPLVGDEISLAALTEALGSVPKAGHAGTPAS